MKLSSAPDVAYCFDFRICMVKFCLYYNCMTMCCGAEMIHHSEMCFPINAGYTKQVIEIEVNTHAQLACNLFPVCGRNKNTHPINTIFKCCSRKQFRYLNF